MALNELEISELRGEFPALQQAVGGRPLIFMDGPAMTDFVMTGYTGAGVQMMINTCGAGEGNKMPFAVGADSPSPILPIIKMTGSTEHYRRKSNKIDFA